MSVREPVVEQIVRPFRPDRRGGVWVFLQQLIPNDAEGVDVVPRIDRFLLLGGGAELDGDQRQDRQTRHDQWSSHWIPFSTN